MSICPRGFNHRGIGCWNGRHYHLAHYTLIFINQGVTEGTPAGRSPEAARGNLFARRPFAAVCHESGDCVKNSLMCVNDHDCRLTCSCAVRGALPCSSAASLCMALLLSAVAL